MWCKIVYVAEAIPDDNDEIALIIESLYEGMAASFIVGHRKNVMRGLTYNAERALYNGVRIYGYIGQADAKYQVDPETAPIVQKIFQDYADGIPMQVICNELKSKGLKTRNGNDFTINSLRRILTNTAYTGVYKWGEHEIEDGMPRIISDDLFIEVQKRLEANQRGGKGALKLVSADEEIADYWLSGHIFCGLCGESMQGVAGTSKKKTIYHYYSCKGHRKHKCSMHNQPKGLLEKIVLHVLEEVVHNPACKYMIAEKCYAYYQLQNSDNGVYEASLKSQLKETENKILNLMKALEAGIWGETTAERLKVLESTKSRLQDALIAEQNRQKFDIKFETILKWLESFTGDLSDIANRKEIMEDFLEKIVVFEDRLVVTFRYINKEQVLPFAQTSAIIENRQHILDIFEQKAYSGNVSKEMLDSVINPEGESDSFF